MSLSGDIKYVPDSCNKEVKLLIFGSSSPICPSSKMVLSLFVTTNRPMPSESRANSQVWDESWAIRIIPYDKKGQLWA